VALELNRRGIAAKRLSVIQGGLAGWVQAGLPTE
jgi:rhodanese-related sulfurtransferase